MSTVYPSLAQELGIKNKKQYNVNDDMLDVTLNDPGLTPNEIDSATYNNDFKKFRVNLTKDIAKYHSLEVGYGKATPLLTRSPSLVAFVSFILSGIDAIMSSMI